MPTVSTASRGHLPESPHEPAGRHTTFADSGRYVDVVRPSGDVSIPSHPVGRARHDDADWAAKESWSPESE